MVMTSPGKLPISPNVDGVSQTSALAAPPKANEAAINTAVVVIFLFMAINSLPRIIFCLQSYCKNKFFFISI